MARFRLFTNQILLLCFFSITFGCRIFNPVILEAPDTIRHNAWIEADSYLGMEYEWGGQDFPPRGIDCSGLVVNVYYSAVQGTRYCLLFSDASVLNIYESYSHETDQPEQGDLIFMGDADSDQISHIAIFGEIKQETVHFIDSTLKDDPPINGVTYRKYPLNDPRIKAFGRLLLRLR